jgi:hypothetical protein
VTTVTSNDCGSYPVVAAAGIALPFPLAQNQAQPSVSVTASAKYLLVTGAKPAGAPAAQNAPEQYRLQLDGSQSSDRNAACSGPLTFNWTLYQRPPGSSGSVNPQDAALPVFTPDVVGDFNFQLAVSDGRFTSVPSYLRITVEDPLNVFVPGVPARSTLWNDAASNPPFLATDPPGTVHNPSVAFYQARAGSALYDLKIAICTGNCSTSGSSTWTVETIDDAGGTLGVLDTSVALSITATAQVSLRYLAKDQPVVAYRDNSRCFMRYAVRNPGATCTRSPAGSPWCLSDIEQIATPDCSGIHGEIALMLLGGTTPAVAYHSHNPTSSAHYAVCTAGCATGVGVTWQTHVITDNALNYGHYMTAALDPKTGRPRAAFQENGTTALYYNACLTAACAAGTADWATGPAANPVAIDTGNLGYWNSMAVQTLPAPASCPVTNNSYRRLTGVAYNDKGNNQVKLATCDSCCSAADVCAPTCLAATTDWTKAVVDTLVAGDYFTLLQYDSLGRAHITYIDPNNAGGAANGLALRYAIQTDAGATAPFRYFEVDHGVTDGHSSFILTPLGSTHVSYALTTGLKFYPFGD